jgi:hypothetical protein
VCPRCLEAFGQAFPESRHRLRLAHRGGHTAPPLRLPANVCLVCVPPYGPELTPMERVWRDRKDARAWCQFATLAGPHDYSATCRRGYEAATL